MARRALNYATELRRKLFLTPAESAADAKSQLDHVNFAMAAQRHELSDSIMALVQERTKKTHRCLEIKLTINQAALETCLGEQAVIEIATMIARRIIERHRALVATQKKPEQKELI